jgi:competence protein ComFB
MLLDRNLVTTSLVNENIYNVVGFLNNYLKNDDVDICTCEECLLDITAIALNNLKPRYRLICRHMHKEPEVVNQIKKEVEEVVLKSLEFVKKNPHH